MDTEDLLNRIEELLRDREQEFDCFGKGCVLHFKDDSDCGRVGHQLEKLLAEAEHVFDKYFKVFGRNTDYYSTIRIVKLHLDNDLEDGIETTKQLIEDIKTVAVEMISQTPWATNHNVTKITISALEETELKAEYAKYLRDAYDKLLKYELEYRQCRDGVINDEYGVVFCITYIGKLIYNEEGDDELKKLKFFEEGMIAENIFPFLRFSLPFYYLAKNTEERAALLGSLGFIAGHEVSHTLIQDDSDYILTYFSDEAKDCIQDQYNTTCNEFKEIGCDTYDKQIDENGADVLSLQIVYQMLEEEYGDKLHDIYESLNITYQQLFFYSNVVFFCDGNKQDVSRNDDGSLEEHASSYIRMNAMTNHPAFREAFQCSEDSRMVKSATEQCIIYGEGASQNKRR